MVMILMVVIALLVIVTVQSSGTEMRISTNEADRKFAVSKAEEGLRAGEHTIQSLLDDYIISNGSRQTVFSGSCANGFCSPTKDSFTTDQKTPTFEFDSAEPPTISAWERAGVLDVGCHQRTQPTCRVTQDGARYIIEYLGGRVTTDNENYEYFRITSRASGNNADTDVLLQTYIEVEY